MKGHFRKPGDKWYFWAELGTDGEGKRRQASRGWFRTRREAEAAFAAMHDELRMGTFVSESKTSVKDFLVDEELPATRVSIRPSTLDNYSSAMKRYVTPRIGSQQLGRVTPAMLNALYADLLATGRSGGLHGLSTKTVKEVHTILHKALHDAVRWGRLGRNPADLADPPAARSPEMQVWSAEQLRKFLKSVEGDRLYAILADVRNDRYVARWGLGLRWRDVDHKHERIAVVQSLLIVEHKRVFSEPTLKKGRRSVALDPTTPTASRSHRAAQAQERLLAGEMWTDSGLVFTTEPGGPIDPQRVTRNFGALSEAAGLPHIRLHDVRIRGAGCGRAREGRQRAPRPRQHCDHPRHLLARPSGVARGRSREDRSVHPREGSRR